MKKLGWNFVANEKQKLCECFFFCFHKVHFRKYGYKQIFFQDNSHEMARGKERPIRIFEIKRMFN